MLEVIATSAVVSRGYDGAAALRFSEKGDAVRFRIGKKVYDTRAENNTRWINLTVKAFGDICERIKKMQLKDGSFINFRGRLDEDVWTDQQTGESKSTMVVVLDDIEYAGGKPKENQESNRQQNGTAPNTGAAAPAQPAAQSAAGQTPNGFTGYEPFGGGSFFSEN
ncbi:single-stranded DNA-binding protein [Longicatena caecimuris]|uniref:single-stranded DNA-binding protein n=1 Tax=Longicatena caecimuris TaxID=1796635 RepID=UPI001D026B6F|nr:single-stranded DNA-binding protein [Longicatena caecimuris]MCB5393460.1 single-stranded DNA-binding protein [Longicatena caecimuris]MCB5564415.1 single-stranded DNA-binding protein [Longicatena caecimuris]